MRVRVLGRLPRPLKAEQGDELGLLLAAVAHRRAFCNTHADAGMEAIFRSALGVATARSSSTQNFDAHPALASPKIREPPTSGWPGSGLEVIEVLESYWS